MLLTSSHTVGQMAKNAKAAAWFMCCVVGRKEFCCRMSFSLIIYYSNLNMSQLIKECQPNSRKFLRVLSNEMHLDEVLSASQPATSRRDRGQDLNGCFGVGPFTKIFGEEILYLIFLSLLWWRFLEWFLLLFLTLFASSEFRILAVCPRNSTACHQISEGPKIPVKLRINKSLWALLLWVLVMQLWNFLWVFSSPVEEETSRDVSKRPL